MDRSGVAATYVLDMLYKFMTGKDNVVSRLIKVIYMVLSIVVQQ